ncbi:phosphotransferase [Paludibaculum fermentans]|uniref:phosphotransferase n=1 Tax=Paludibaculum fermentans TaxID=1473598 RepID=UPI003EBDC213
MIPQEKSEAVSRGLRDAFGVSGFDDISVLTGGHTSSLVFRIVVAGSPYVLKIITRAEDPTRHYNCMRAAAEAGLAPRVWYTSVEDHISITDFVTVQPLPVPQALVRLPAVLRTLHALPAFERAPFNTTCTFLLGKGPALDGFLHRFQNGHTLSPADAGEWAARYAELAAVYPYDDAEMVASHNDLFKPDNILFDGRHPWLIDWEAAFLNDRYADLAVVANHVVTNDAGELAFLQEYFGAPPSEYQRARFHLMRQLVHLFYTMAFLTLGSGGQPVDWSEPVPTFREYHRRMWAHEVDLADNAQKLIYGRAHWEQLVENVRQARYQEALRIVAARPV